MLVFHHHIAGNSAIPVVHNIVNTGEFVLVTAIAVVLM